MSDIENRSAGDKIAASDTHPRIAALQRRQEKRPRNIDIVITAITRIVASSRYPIENGITVSLQNKSC